VTDDHDLQVPQPALLFDLDGTLVDSVYQHVIAWQEALTACGIELSVWRIHRRIGMSGGLFIDALSARPASGSTTTCPERLRTLHAEAYLRRHESVVPLPGARELLAHLHERGVPFAIATSGARHTAGSALAMLGLPDDVPVVTRDLVERAKPDPHLFLAAARRLDVDPRHCLRGGRQRLGPAGRAARGSSGIGLAVRRVRPGGAGAIRRIPGLRRPRRDADAARGGRRPPGPLTPQARRGPVHAPAAIRSRAASG
jgi:beta-phosphoglucomutase-like phosphatase (HAD superfamily)